MALAVVVQQGPGVVCLWLSWGPWCWCCIWCSQVNACFLFNEACTLPCEPLHRCLGTAPTAKGYFFKSGVRYCSHRWGYFLSYWRDWHQCHGSLGNAVLKYNVSAFLQLVSPLTQTPSSAQTAPQWLGQMARALQGSGGFPRTPQG